MLYITHIREDAARHEVGDSVGCFSPKPSLEDYISLTCLRVASDISFNFMFPLEDIALLFLGTLLLKFTLTEKFLYKCIKYRCVCVSNSVSVLFQTSETTRLGDFKSPFSLCIQKLLLHLILSYYEVCWFS